MNPGEIFLRLEGVVGVNGGPRKLLDAITGVLVQEGIAPLEAFEWAERIEVKVQRAIHHRESEARKSGTMPVLALHPRSERVVLGSCHVLPTDSEEVSRYKRQRIGIGGLLEAVQALPFSDFEVLGAKILRELGAKRYSVTPRSGDQGVDFYGTLDLAGLTRVPSGFEHLAHTVQLGFMGQAKHYPDRPIGPGVVRELIGSLSLARHRVFTRELRLFEDLQLGPANPVVAFLFTTGRFTTGASRLAREAGVVTQSGEQLAVFLADRGVGIKEDDGGLRFEAGSFETWLEEV